MQGLKKTNPCLDEYKKRNPPSIAAQSVSVNSFPFLFVFLIAQNVALQAGGARWTVARWRWESRPYFRTKLRNDAKARAREPVGLCTVPRLKGNFHGKGKCRKPPERRKRPQKMIPTKGDPHGEKARDRERIRSCHAVRNIRPRSFCRNMFRRP